MRAVRRPSCATTSASTDPFRLRPRFDSWSAVAPMPARFGGIGTNAPHQRGVSSPAVGSRTFCLTSVKSTLSAHYHWAADSACHRVVLEMKHKASDESPGSLDQTMVLHGITGFSRAGHRHPARSQQAITACVDRGFSAAAGSGVPGHADRRARCSRKPDRHLYPEGPEAGHDRQPAACRQPGY